MKHILLNTFDNVPLEYLHAHFTFLQIIFQINISHDRTIREPSTIRYRFLQGQSYTNRNGMNFVKTTALPVLAGEDFRKISTVESMLAAVSIC